MANRDSKSIRIQLAEDHEVVRSGFHYLLECEGDMEIVAESANGVQACRDYDQHKPDVLVLDISLPDMSGLEVIQRILSRYPEARILVLSMYASTVITEAALQLGARGYISKQCAVRDLVMAIRKLMRGEHYVEPESAEKLARSKREMDEASPLSLTKRELEVGRLLTKGQSVSSIAEQMHLSEKTVYTHREHILHKLGVKTVAALSQVAFILDIYTNVS